ncbi:MAG: methylated-DNA--[protein]-cysteine S-methyltransferase [Ginsengibacter sp.]
MIYQSPVGLLKINFDNDGVYEIIYCDEETSGSTAKDEVETSQENTKFSDSIRQQFDEYFSGKRLEFDFPFHQRGTVFQKQVWAQLVKIPYGSTISYLQLSKRIDNLKAIRAVGTANGRNNLSIVVPCHRVIGSNGNLTGYAGGLWRKQWLLEHESKFAHGTRLLF